MQIQLQRHVRRDCRQLLGHHHLLALLLQRLAIALVGNFAGMIQRVLDASVFLDQFGCSLLADSLRARDVVHRVAHQRHQVDHLLRRHAQNLFHFFLIHKNVGLRTARSRPQRSNIISHQLHHVLVVRNDQHFELLFRPLHGQRANHVVRFITLKLQNRQTHRFAQLSNIWNLHGEIVRHRRALRFVFFK